ncbi:MAG: hypothetical protein CME36_02575 [unclassified Hahellaceae]|jgi:transposase|nr:hypothetical protein [Hahellaceae bacterium]|tara:strand:- start:7456 stop:7746 length:291 start_codon:yes stop_codon:yes gene_type:complete
MKEFNANDVRVESASALKVVQDGFRSDFYSLYVGLDMHKENIGIAVARPGRGEPEYRGEIGNTPMAVEKLIQRLSEEPDGGIVQFCYEAGPCGCGL